MFVIKLTVLALLITIFQHGHYICGSKTNSIGPYFVQTRGAQFVLNGNPIYFNGFNAYWLMLLSADPDNRAKVSTTLEEAAVIYGMNVARTNAFSDGRQNNNPNPLQISPGEYSEDMFKALDFVLSEAVKYGIRLILSLVNNWDDFGGRKQYVEWARGLGQNITGKDVFFSNYVVREMFKNHTTKILTRINSITRIAYKDDPVIFAWELINEPRCPSDPTGNILQGWIIEMAKHVKSIDKNHLLQVGLEGFYGESKKEFNPNYQIGTDFIANNQVPEVDFATIHLYTDRWLPDLSHEEQLVFEKRWLQSHIEDANTLLKKPLLLSEFGKSSTAPGYTPDIRESDFKHMYWAFFECANNNGACGGTMFWQLLGQGMDNYGDGYAIVLKENPSTDIIISDQSFRLFNLTNHINTSALEVQYGY